MWWTSTCLSVNCWSRLKKKKNSGSSANINFPTLNVMDTVTDWPHLGNETPQTWVITVVIPWRFHSGTDGSPQEPKHRETVHNTNDPPPTLDQVQVAHRCFWETLQETGSRTDQPHNKKSSIKKIVTRLPQNSTFSPTSPTHVWCVYTDVKPG